MKLPPVRVAPSSEMVSTRKGVGNAENDQARD
jgi:hypothetical protein